MTSSNTGQVEFTTLLFGMNWEDPESDRQALHIQPGDAVVAITSGGCNALGFLLEDPRKVHAIDINVCQSHLLELKCAAIRRLDAEDLHAFLGLRPSPRRADMFEALAPDLSEPARNYWRGWPEAIRDGIAHQGRYEQFLRRFRQVLRLIHGTRRIERLFECATLDEQAAYFDQVWNTVGWRMLFRMVANKRVLASRGLTADYFRFDDGAQSFAESFFNRSRRAFRDIPVASNYFLAQYLLGRYLDAARVPAYLQPNNLAVVRARIDRIRIVTDDLKQWLARQPAGSIDAISLSNICELMSPQETAITFQQLARTARPGAGICFRNLIVPRAVPENLQARIWMREDLSRRLLAGDRSFVYGRVNAYVAAAAA